MSSELEEAVIRLQEKVRQYLSPEEAAMFDRHLAAPGDLLDLASCQGLSPEQIASLLSRSAATAFGMLLRGGTWSELGEDGKALRDIQISLYGSGAWPDPEEWRLDKV